MTDKTTPIEWAALAFTVLACCLLFWFSTSVSSVPETAGPRLWRAQTTSQALGAPQDATWTREARP